MPEAAEYLLRYQIEVNSNTEQFAQQWMRDLQRIEAAAQAAEQRLGTGSTGLGGVVSQFEAAKTAAAGSLAAAGNPAAAVQGFERALNAAGNRIREVFEARHVQPFNQLSSVGLVEQSQAALREVRAAAAGSGAARSGVLLTPPTEGIVGDTIAARQQAAADDSALASSKAYATANAEAAAELLRRTAAENEALAGSATYIEANAAAATALRRRSAAENEALAGDRTYIEANAAAATALRRRSAAEAEALVGEQGYIEASAREAVAKRRSAAEIEAATVSQTTLADISQAAQNRLAQERIKMAEALQVEQRTLAIDNERAGQLAAARARNATAVSGAQLAATTPEDLAASGKLAAERQLQAADTQLAQIRAAEELGSGERSYAAVLGRTKAAREEEQAAIKRATAEALAASPTFVGDTAAANRLRTATAQKVTLTELGLPIIAGENEAASAARIAVAQQANVNRRRLEELTILQASESEEAALIVERKLLEKTYNRELNQRVQAEINARYESGELQHGTRYQRFQAAGAARQGGTPKLETEYATLGQQLGSRFSTTAGFAVSGVATYAAFALLRSSIKDAEELNKSLALLRSQAEAIGQGGRSFEVLRNSILATSQATGVSATEVAKLASEFLGLYGNAAQAAQATDDAAKIIRVLGVSAQTAGPQIAAIAEDFNASVKDVGNTVLDLQDKTGRAGGDMLAALGQVAPVANELNLSLNQTRGLIEAVAVGSAKSGQQLGEGLARVLPELQKNLPKLQSQTGISFSVEAKTGNTKQALEELLTQYGHLDAAQKQLAISLLGGPRNAQILASALRDPTKALAALNSQVSDQELLDRRAAAAQESLRGALDKFHTAVTAVGEGLVRSGIGALLKDVVIVGAEVFSVVGRIISAFEAVNRVTGGWAKQVVELVVAWKAFTLASNLHLFERLGVLFERAVGSLNAMTTATAANTAAETTNTGAHGANAAAIEVETGAEVADAAAKAAETVAAGAETVAEGTNAVARSASGLAGAAGRAVGGLGRLGGRLGGAAGAGAAAEGAGALEYTGIAGGVGLGPLAVTTIGAGLLLHKAIDEENKAVKKAVTGYRQKLHEMNDAELNKAVQEQRGDPNKEVGNRAVLTDALKQTYHFAGDVFAGKIVFGGHGGHVVGYADARDAVKSGSALYEKVREQNDRRIKQMRPWIDALLQGGVFDEATQKQIADLIAKGDQKSFEELNTILVQGLGSDKGRQVFQSYVKQKAAIDPLTRATQGSVTTIDEAKDAYQQGDISLQQYIDALNREADAYKDFPDPADKKKRADYLKTAAKARSDALKAAADQQGQFDEQFLGRGVEGDIAAQRGIIRSPDADKASRAAAGQKILEDQRKDFERQLNTATSEAARQRLIANRPQLDPEALAAINDYRGQQNQPALDVGTGQLQLTQAEQDKIDKDTRSSFHRLTQAKLALAKSRAKDDPVFAALTEQKIAADQLKQAEEDYTKDSPEYIAAQTAAQNADNATEKAMLGLAHAKSSLAEFILGSTGRRDTVGAALIAQQQAAQDLQQALDDARASGVDPAQSQAVLDAQQKKAQADRQVLADQANLTKARQSYLSTLHPADALAIAKDAQQAALSDLAQLRESRATLQAHVDAGKATAEEYRVAGDLAKADQGVIDVIQATGIAHLNLIKAQLTASGDVVGAAREQVTIIQQEIANALARGATQGGTEITTLRAQLVTAQADVAKTQTSFVEQQIQNNLDLQRITVGQAVAQLRALEALQTSQAERDAIELKVRQLLKSSVSGLEFNLPTDINLPTLYEVRRLNATPTGSTYGGGTVDNRRQQFFFSVTGASLDQVQRTVAAAIGSGSSQFGSTPRRY